MLNAAKLKTLKPEAKPYQLSDGGGLFIEILPSAARVWRLRYRLNGTQEKVTLGDFPAYSLADARSWRDDCKALIARNLSPMSLKRGDPVPTTTPEARKLGMDFLSRWCPKTAQAHAAQDTVSAFAARWFAEVVAPNIADPTTIKRVLDKDVLPAIGAKSLAEVTVSDVLAITDAIKARGADHMALQTRNVIKRLFAYAIAREKATFNPAQAVESKYIAQASSRDVALSQGEIGQVLRSIYTSSMKRSHKLALHLLMVTMVRKSELIEARWEEVDFENGVWEIPSERMKMDKAHIVPLSRQALAMLEELQSLSCESGYLFPSSRTLGKPISHTTLNVAIKSLDCEVRGFTIHDFRRTASTHLHESGFSSDWIEKALAHETRGIRGVYNRAKYRDQRREMLQWWADMIDSLIDDGRKVVIGRFGKAA